MSQQNTDTDGEKDPEELLQQSMDQTRHNTEPTNTDTSDETPDTQAAIRAAFEDIEDGDTSSNTTVRDTKLAALLRGVEATGELGELADAAWDELGRDSDESVSRSQVLGALARVGLDVVAPDLVDTARDARKEYVLSKEDDF